MELAQPFTASEVEQMIVSAVEKLFTTMFSQESTLEETIQVQPVGSGGENPRPMVSDKSVVAAAVGYIGSVNGVIYLYFEEEMAKRLTSQMLGMEMHEVEAEGHETVNDALGEVTNMIVGTFKNKMCDKGFNCRLTIPSILRGNSFIIEHSAEINRTIFRFKVFDSMFAVDMLMKNSE